MSSLLRSTGIVALATLASRILGFIRDMVMASYFGATGMTDAFYVAFKIPNVFRRVVAEGALTVSFIPVYTEYMVNRGEREALELAQKTLTILLLALVSLVLLGEVFSPQIVRLFAMGFTDRASYDLAVFLNRVMFPYLFFISLVAFAMGVLNSRKYFFAPAFSPVLLNVGIITGVVILSRFFEEPLLGASLGVILGGVMQLALQIPYMIKAGFRVKISLDFSHPGIRRIFFLLGPAVFGMAVYQINSLIVTILASWLKSGSISYLYYCDRLTEIVLGVFIVSIGNVILPEMSRMSAAEDFEKLKGIYVTALRSSLFLAVPAAFALMALGLPIVSTLFMRNNFTADDARMTNMALFYASMGIPSVAMLRITSPTFYSLKDTRTPVIGALLALVSNTVIGSLLMNTPLLHGGLTAALSISTTVQMAYLLVCLRRKIGSLGFRPIFVSFVKFTAASMVMTAFCMALSWRVSWTTAHTLTRVGWLSAAVFGGIAVYGAMCYLLKVEEMRYIVRKIKEKRG
jgi:putative peptidoglycan lipid II flippase